jgi:hypothetical protein
MGVKTEARLGGSRRLITSGFIPDQIPWCAVVKGTYMRPIPNAVNLNAGMLWRRLCKPDAFMMSGIVLHSRYRPYSLSQYENLTKPFSDDYAVVVAITEKNILLLVCLESLSPFCKFVNSIIRSCCHVINEIRTSPLIAVLPSFDRYSGGTSARQTTISDVTVFVNTALAPVVFFNQSYLTPASQKSASSFIIESGICVRTHWSQSFRWQRTNSAGASLRQERLH